MNFALYLAMTNRTNPSSPYLKDWEQQFLKTDWPDAIESCTDSRMLLRLAEFAERVRDAATGLKLHDLEEEARMIANDCRTFSRKHETV